MDSKEMEKLFCPVVNGLCKTKNCVSFVDLGIIENKYYYNRTEYERMYPKHAKTVDWDLNHTLLVTEKRSRGYCIQYPESTKDYRENKNKETMLDMEKDQTKEIEEVKLEVQNLKKEIERLREIERVARTYLVFDRCSCGLLKRSGYLCANNECKES